MALAVAMSVVVGCYRYRSEEANHTVQIAVDYGQVSLLARYLGMPRAELLRTLREAGVGAVLVKEPLVSDLDGELLWGIYPVWIRLGGELAASAYLPREVLPQIRPDCTYLVFDDPRVAEQVAIQLNRKLPEAQSRVLAAGTLFLVEAPWSKSQLASLRVGIGFAGFPWEELDKVGLKAIPQIRPWSATDASSVRAAVEDFLPYKDRLSVIAFDDDRVPGYPYFLPDLARAIRELGAPVGIIEFTPQKGLPSLVKLTGKQAVRVHSIRPEEARTLSPSRAVARLVLAASERNIRVLVVRFAPFGEALAKPSGYLASVLDYLGELRQGLAVQGLVLGDPRPFAPFPLPRAVFAVIGLGAWAAAVLLMRELGIKGRPLRALSVVGMVGYLLLLRTDFLLARQAAAAVAAVAFPTLGVLVHRSAEPCPLPRALAQFAATLGASLAGAALVVGLLGEVGFMLAVDQFLGTKLAHLAPPVLVALALWAVPQGREGLKRSLSAPVTWVCLLGLAAAALAGYVYLVRTGNEGTALVASWERTFRQLLDELLLVRPRTKEFLLGHPLLLLGYRLGARRWYLLLWIVGSIGQASVVNTFAHVHTPLAVCLLRAANGAWLGIGLGLFLFYLVGRFDKNR